MDDFKLRAGEKLGALHDAALGAANNSKIRLNDAVDNTVAAVAKIREVFLELWQHELVEEGRARASAWAAEAARRVREGALPLSPAELYRELVDLLKDRVWRRSMMIFIFGAALGGGAGLLVGLRAGTRLPSGPHTRALHTQSDQTVILVEDTVSPAIGAGEVLVRVQSFSVCPADRAVLRGRGSALRSLLAAGPVTLGRGFAGVVLDVGHGVHDLELGDEVWGVVSEWSGGAASELLAIRRSRVSRRPRAVSPSHAAAVPWGARAPCEPSGTASGRESGAREFVDLSSEGWWVPLERAAARAGPWDALALGERAPARPPKGLVKSCSRVRTVSVCARALWSDRVPAPLWPAFCVTFTLYRVLRWTLGLGWHTDWLEDGCACDELDRLRELVEQGLLTPVLDKIYLPHDFEAALAHACGDDAVGTTVVRFP